MTDQVKSPDVSTVRRSRFSLASLGLTVTVLAMMLASANMEYSREALTKLVRDHSWQLVAMLAGATIIGVGGGLAHALTAGLRWRALLYAPILGALAGGLGVMVLIAPGSLKQTVIAIAVILGSTLVFRLGAE
jgi:hypothetical protein